MNHFALILTLALALSASAVELTPHGFTMSDDEIALCKDEHGCVMVSRMRIQQLVELRAAEMNREKRDRAECWQRS